MSDALLSGAFGVAVALITWLLAGYREKQSFRRDLQRDYIHKLENLYAESIELLEMTMRITESLESYKDIERDLSRNNALLSLLSTKEINDQSESISVLMYNWSSLFRKGAPKKVGDTDMAIISSTDSKYSKQAEELRPQLNDEIVKIINLMSAHLKSERERA